VRLQIQNDKEYIKELENYIEILEHEEDRLREKLLNKDKEIERLNNIINKALGIANERFNYYHHTNKKEILEDWENIFNVLLRRDNE
jgi:predicted RNase H-like nuclease (RuvC/YqgF family)